MSFIVTPGQLNRRAELYHQLGSTVSAGIPLIKALEMASVRSSVGGSRWAFAQIIQHLQAGCTFTESLERTEGWLPEFDLALLSAGEKSGRIDSSFHLLADYYESRARIIRESLSQLLLTAVTLHVFLFIFPLRFLVAAVVGWFNGNSSALIPFLIQKVAIFGSIYGAIFLLIFACQSQRGEQWRSIVENIAGTIPILGKARRYLALSRLSAALEALISAGVSVFNAWELAASASGSPHLRTAVMSWRAELEAGRTPAEMVNGESYFPEMFVSLYHTGENTGQLDDALNRLQAYFREEGFILLRRFTRVANGVIYGGVVLTVAYFILNFYMSYFSQITGL